MCPVPGQFMAQLLDQDRLRLYLHHKPRGEAAQLLGIVRQDDGLVEHETSLSWWLPAGSPHKKIAPAAFCRSALERAVVRRLAAMEAQAVAQITREISQGWGSYLQGSDAVRDCRGKVHQKL